VTQTTTPTPGARGSMPTRQGPSPSAPPGTSGYPLAPDGPAAAHSPLSQATARLRALVRSGTAGTPGRLRLWAALAIVVSLAFGLATAQAFRAESEALNRAGANARQLVRIQEIHTELVRADAGATNAFLVGGLEPRSDREQYSSSIAAASRLVAEAAEAQPADGAALAALNSALVTYAGLVEQARATNRQGLPVGAQYLANASQGLREDALPVLDNLVSANQERTGVEFNSTARAALWVVIFGILALGSLIAIMVWVARRTHRLVNTPLSLATAIVLVTGLLAVLTLSSLSGQVRAVSRQSYAVTLEAASARIAGFDAKSRESLTLIKRGSGATIEAQWKSAAATVTEQARKIDALLGGSSDLLGTWTPYARTHARIRALDDGGDWRKAVALATGSSSSSSANATFQAFDAASARVLEAAGADTAAQLSGHRWLPLLGALALMVGLLAAAAAWWGIAVRLEEYR